MPPVVSVSDHDAGDPVPRPDAREHEIARHLEERVAEGEDPRTEAVGGRAEVQVAIHLQRRDRDVRPVEEVANNDR